MFEIEPAGQTAKYRHTRQGDARMVIDVAAVAGAWRVTRFVACNSLLKEGIGQ